LLGEDFETFREVQIEYQHMSWIGRVDLLAVPKTDGKVFDWHNRQRPVPDVVLAFEVKGEGFHLERALKQSADYVGGRVLEGPHRGKSIAACFLYPVKWNCYFQLIAQWRVGRGFVKGGGLWLAIGQEQIWDSSRGWHATIANRMLLSRRKVGGSRKTPWR
jgi:hypothetical protein